MSLVGETDFLFNTSDLDIVVLGFLKPIDATKCFLRIGITAATDKPVR